MGSSTRSRKDLQISWIVDSCVVHENSHLQWNHACLLQITIQSCSSLLCLKYKETEKPLLTASSSRTTLFILLMWMVAAVLRGTLGPCFSTALAQRTELGRACRPCEGELEHHEQNVATASRGCVFAWSSVCYGLVDHLMIYGPQSSLDHQSRNTTIDNPVC